MIKELQSCKLSKLVAKKNSRRFSRVHIVNQSLLSGFDSRRLQSLRACNSAVFWPAGSKNNIYEISDLYLLGKREKKYFPALLRSIMLSQNAPKQMCALAHLGCIYKVGTSKLYWKMTRIRVTMDLFPNIVVNVLTRIFLNYIMLCLSFLDLSYSVWYPSILL